MSIVTTERKDGNRELVSYRSNLRKEQVHVVSSGRVSYRVNNTSSGIHLCRETRFKRVDTNSFHRTCEAYNLSHL